MLSDDFFVQLHVTSSLVVYGYRKPVDQRCRELFVLSIFPAMVGNMEFNDPNCNGNPVNHEDTEEITMEETEEEEMQDDENEEDVIASDQEYSLLDKQLDDLNSVLDVLEQKNDRIHAQLKALLENSREIRQDIATERANSANNEELQE